jgi:uncharacterized protein (DUF2141 family)
MKTIKSSFFLLIALFWLTCHAHAADLTVNIAGAKSTQGKIACALYAVETGFPFDTSKATTQLVPVALGGSICKFTDLKQGTYAVGIVHDLNGNERVDTNIFGVPQESWAVSNNVSHKLRAPTFSEASFKIEQNIEINLRLVH